MGSGALDVDGGEVILNIGADYEGPAEFDSDYLLLKDSLSGSLIKTPFLNYKPAIKMRAHEGTEVLAKIRALF